MVHTYEHAVRIRTAYEYLVGEYHEQESNIIDICIIPADLGQMANFLEHYKELNAAESLLLSGFDEKRVRIVIVFEQTFTLPGYMLELDEFLTRKGIEKAYDRVTRAFVTPN